jgi:hypothetical protein
VTSLLGVAHSMARVTSGAVRLQPGALLEIVTWAAPPSPPLRIWIPQAGGDDATVTRSLRAQASQRGIRWVDDPTDTTPTHLLRRRDVGWELVANGRRIKAGAAPLAQVPAGASLFVEIPVPAQIIQTLGGIRGVTLASAPDIADYVVAGRLTHGRTEYACIRPFVAASDRARSLLPVRTAWVDAGRIGALRDDIVRLRSVQAWQDLRSPAGAESRYRISVRRVSDGALVDDGRLVGNSRYRLALRQRGTGGPLFAQYVYVFVIASDGSSVLLFPPPEIGTVENLLPVTPTPSRPVTDAPAEIPLTITRPFVVGEPYGLDTYVLLCTDEPLPSLSGLEWKGVRGPHRAATRNGLEELLAQTIAGTRAPNEPMPTPPNWTIDRVFFESVPPRSER